MQDLYEQYSALAFTNSWDRPVAILGLQERLAMAFKTDAAYGFFTPYFARLLLWKRKESRAMVRIMQQPGSRHRPPTWSWFSKEGAIKYMELEFQKVKWTTGEFENPLEGIEANSPAKEAVTLRGRARRLSIAKQDLLASATYDHEEEFEVDDLRCVIIGQDKVESFTSPAKSPVKYHVLIIHQVGLLETDIYERVGVASLQLEQVAVESSWINIQ